MRYTDEQKAIINTCRKYKGVKVEFGPVWFCVNSTEDEESFPNDNYDISDVEEWLSEHATPKTVGRPKGSVKPRGKVKRVLSLTKEADEQLSELARKRNESRSAVVCSAIGSLHNIEIMWSEKE